MQRTKVPRASLAVTILDDMDYIAMTSDREGRYAFGAFCVLLIAAKQLDNHGQFSEPLRHVAALVRWTESDLRGAAEQIAACCVANGHEPWFTIDGEDRIRIRNFDRWNAPRGGARPGSGRKPKESNRNQSDFNLKSSANQAVSNMVPSVPVPVPVPDSGVASQHLPTPTESVAPTRAPKRRRSEPTATLNGVAWSSVGWHGITDADRAAWSLAYPACDVPTQLARMHEWLTANPAKAQKRSWRRFVTNWLARAQDRGGDVRSDPTEVIRGRDLVG